MSLQRQIIKMKFLKSSDSVFRNDVTLIGSPSLLPHTTKIQMLIIFLRDKEEINTIVKKKHTEKQTKKWALLSDGTLRKLNPQLVGKEREDK